MKKAFRKNSSLLLTIFFILLFTAYFASNYKAFEPVARISIIGIISIVLLKLLILAVQGLFTKFMLEVFDKRISHLESFMVSSLSAIGNFFGPLLGGASVRAVYLKKNHKLSYSKFISTLSGYYLIMLITNSFIAIIGLLMIDSSSGKVALLLFFITWLIMMLVIAFGSLPKKYKPDSSSNKPVFKKLLKSIYEVETGWKQLKNNPRLLHKLTILAIFAYIVNFITNYIEFSVLGLTTGFAILSLYTALTILSLLVAITPGSIGIREFIFILTSGVLGITNSEILQLALIDRGITYGTLFILGILIQPMRKKIKSDAKQ